MISVRSTATVPPGGAWFWEDGDHLVSDPDYRTAVDAVARILRDNGSSADPEQELLGFMAPRMPAGWAVGYSGPRARTFSDYLKAAVPYYGRQVERVDNVMRRMEVCRLCPRFRREGCLTCRKIPEYVENGFKGRRAAVPSVDSRSGICVCAGTFNMVVASVTYDKNEAVWEGTPPTCWRFLK